MKTFASFLALSVGSLAAAAATWSCGGAARTVTPSAIAHDAGAGDLDGDGVPDDLDFCPQLPAASESGCHEEIDAFIVARLRADRHPCPPAGEQLWEELVCPSAFRVADPAGAEGEEDEGYDEDEEYDSEEGDGETVGYEEGEPTADEEGDGGDEGEPEEVAGDEPEDVSVAEAPGHPDSRAEALPAALASPSEGGRDHGEPVAERVVGGPSLAEVAARIRAIGTRLGAAAASAQARVHSVPWGPDEDEGSVFVRLHAEHRAMCDEGITELRALSRSPIFRWKTPDSGVEQALRGISQEDGSDLRLFCSLWERHAEVEAAIVAIRNAWSILNAAERDRACGALRDAIGSSPRDCDARAAGLARLLRRPEADFLYRMVGEHECDLVSSSLSWDACRDHPGVHSAWCSDVRRRDELTFEIAVRCGLTPIERPAPDTLTPGECRWLGARISGMYAREGFETPGTWSVEACVAHLRHADYFCIADADAGEALTGCRATFAP